MSSTTRATDLPARVLEFGLAALVLIAPLPFGSVVPGGRLVLEVGAFGLLVIWLARGFALPTPVPSKWVLTGAIALVGLTGFQILPIGDGPLASISPESAAIQSATRPPELVRAAEERIIGSDPSRLEGKSAISPDPSATASALRTGLAAVALLLVATTVAATRGPRLLALALLVSGGFQGLYGLLVLASSHDMIWHLPKSAYLDSATGTFVNRNHFACFLAMSLPCGLAMIVRDARRSWGGGSLRGRALARTLGGAGSRNLLLLVPFLLGLAGLLISFSRAGTALGVGAILLTAAAVGRDRKLRRRLVVAALIVAAAVIPLAQLGPQQLVDRYSRSAQDFDSESGRRVVWSDTARMASAFPFLGSGFGTFATVYPRFRSPEVRLFYAHAHNDVLQAWAEGGALGLILLALLVLPILSVAGRSIGGSKGTMAVGFGCGLLAVAGHSLVDFNLHIPANLATAAILAGTLLGLPWTNHD